MTVAVRCDAVTVRTNWFRGLSRGELSQCPKAQVLSENATRESLRKEGRLGRHGATAPSSQWHLTREECGTGIGG